MTAKPLQVDPSATTTQPSGKTAPKTMSRNAWLWAFLIALAFALWDLHTVTYNNIVDTDGARHATNGAFVHDVLSGGHASELLHPAELLHFAKNYYVHLPALSLPYHPPLFPFVEALFFFVFGVSVFAARLAIAAAVALAILALFRLIMTTYGSVFAAALATTMFLCLPIVLWLGSDVMLEFPALVFVVLAMQCLADVDEEYPLRRALLFAVLAGAAVWSKQQTVFLGAVPFVYFALLGRWRLIFKPAIWISSAVLLTLVGLLALLSLPVHGVGVNQALPPEGHRSLFLHHILFYFKTYPYVVGPAGLILLAAFLAALAGRVLPRRATALFGAWILSVLLVLWVLAPFSGRYLFFAIPPMFVLGSASLAAFIQHWQTARRWALPATGLLVIAALLHASSEPMAFMRGPDETARFLAQLGPRRILYCGGTDGNFIFSYRSHHPQLDTVILAGDKLPHDVFTAPGLSRFVADYGVQYVVLERASHLTLRQQHPWEALIDAPPSNMLPVRDIALASSDRRWNGLLRVYRVTNPTATPTHDVMMRMNMIGGNMRFTIEQSSKPKP